MQTMGFFLYYRVNSYIAMYQSRIYDLFLQLIVAFFFSRVQLETICEKNKEKKIPNLGLLLALMNSKHCTRKNLVYFKIILYILFWIPTSAPTLT